MQRSEGVGRRSARIATELVVIVAGVLIALAADRWNHGRADRASEAAYLGRFVEEIEGDSTRAAAYLEGRPSMLAGLDSLMSFVDGAPPPPNLAATVLAVSDELVFPPVVAWTEIQATNSLDLIRDPEIRAVLTDYYASRERGLLQWSRQDSRARNPLWDELYRMGLFDPKDEFGSPGPASQAVDTFRSWPRIRQLLLALGAGHYFQRYNATTLLESASAALRRLRAAD